MSSAALMVELSPARPCVALALPPGIARDTAKRALDRHYTVQVFADFERLLAHLTSTGPVAVVVFDWTMLGKNAAGAFAVLQGQAPQTPFIAIVDKTPFSEMPTIFSAGVSDLIRTPLQPDELTARIARVQVQQPLPMRGPCCVGLEQLPLALADDLSAFMGTALSCTVRKAGLLDDHELLVACLPLHLVQDSLEVQVFVAARRPVLCSLARHMLAIDEADDDVTNDLCRELANLAAGSLKRACSPRDAPLTMGLPRTVERCELPDPAWCGHLVGTGVDLSVLVRQIHRPPILVGVADLREGMVVIVDLKSAAGALLLAAGSRLTTTTVSGVRRFLPEGARVQVLDLQ